MDPMATLLALLFLAAQGPPDPARDLLEKLEARAAKARGLVVRTHALCDALGGDELHERSCGSGVLEVAPSGAVWDEGWIALIGPERKGITTLSIRTLTSAEERLQFVRHLQGFGPGMGDKFLETRPKGGPWKAHSSLDPWMSRDQRGHADPVDPLLLYSLAPGLLRTEAELKIGSEDADSWTLETRREGKYGPITKRFTIRKSDLAIPRLDIRESNRLLEFETTSFETIRGVAIPVRNAVRNHDWASLTRWNHRIDPDAPEPRERSRKDFPEPLFASPGWIDRNALLLRLELDPADVQALVDLSWGDAPWKKWWHYRYFEEIGSNQGMIEKLWKLFPKSAVLREDWLRRPTRAGQLPGGDPLADFEAPLANRAMRLLQSKRAEPAIAMARKALEAETSPGDRLNWTCLLCAALSLDGKKSEAATAWLDLVKALDDGRPETAVFLSEIALGRGLVSGLDPEGIAGRAGEAGAAIPLLALGRSGSVRALAANPSARPLMSELLAAGKFTDAALEKDLAAIPDVDALLSAAALRFRAGGDPAEHAEAALALWEKESYCRLWTWDVWGRTTLRMIKQLRGMGDQARGIRLSSRFIEKCAEGKVGMWLGHYRWGETVGEAILPLRDQEKEDRLVELLALCPEFATRFAFSQRDGFVPPFQAMIKHLEQSRSPEEARAWIQLASYFKVDPGELQPLLKLAAQIAPKDLWVENQLVESKKDAMPAEQRVDLCLRTLEAVKQGRYRDHSGSGAPAFYERLAEAQIDAHRLEDAMKTIREMRRESPDFDSMTLLNFGNRMTSSGRTDLAKELYVAAARHNAHLRPFSAQTAIERLEPMGESAEIFTLCIRTLSSWKNPPPRENFDARSLAVIREAKDRVAAKVSWDEVFKPWMELPRPALRPETEVLARKAVEDLGADSIEERDRAERILMLLSDGAVPLLRPAALTGAPEERARARAILEQIYVATWK